MFPRGFDVFALAIQYFPIFTDTSPTLLSNRRLTMYRLASAAVTSSRCRFFAKPPVADLAEAEDVLDHAEHVLDLGAYPRLVAVLRLLELIDPAVVAIAAVGEVLRPRRASSNDGAFDPDSPGRPRPASRCRAAGTAAPRDRAHWPPTPAPCGSASSGCRRRRAPSCRSTTAGPSPSDASPGRARRPRSWSSSARR